MLFTDWGDIEFTGTLPSKIIPKKKLNVHTIIEVSIAHLAKLSIIRERLFLLQLNGDRESQWSEERQMHYSIWIQLILFYVLQ